MKKWLALLFTLIASPALAQGTVVPGDIFKLNTGPCYMRSGSGSPEGVVTAVCGTYFDTSSKLIWRKTGSGNTGWVLVGTVTSVGLSLPAMFDVTGSPVTTSGTLTAALATQAATSVFAGPSSGSAAAPTFQTSPTLTGLTVNNSETFAALGSGTFTYAPTAPIFVDTAAVIRQKASGQPNYTTDWWVDGTTGTTYFVAYDSTGSTYLALKFQGSAIGLDGNTTITGTATITGNTNISGYVGHPSFTSQTAKWRIDNLGGADFRYIYTDELHAKAFITDLEQALAGGQIISKSVAPLAEAFTCPAIPGIGTIAVSSFPGYSNVDVFVANDYVVARQFSRAGGGLTIADCVGIVSGMPTYSVDGMTQTWIFTRPSFGAGAVTPGDIIGAKTLALDYGVSGNGAYEVNAIDGIGAANSPYMQIKTWTGTPAAANWTTRTRCGNLKGITGTLEWGCVMGTWNATAGQYLLMSDQHFEIHGVKMQMFSGATEVMRLDPLAVSFAMGTSLPTSFTSGSGCWQGMDAGVFKWRCGDPSGATHYIGWNGTTLTVAGNIVVTGTSIDAATVTGVAGATVVSGAARGLLGIGSTGNPLLPATATPSGSGLFLGSDFMGYYTASAWKTFMDSSGGFYLGGTSGSLRWNGTTLTINGGGTFSGALSAATGTFSGALSAATGTFAGSLSAATGSFAGSLSAATGTFAGNLSAAGGTFAGSLSAATGTFAGSLSAATGSFSGTVTASSLTATTAGNIAGWLLSATSITDASGQTGLNSTVTGGDDCRFFAGNVTCSSAPFRVYESGAVNLNSGSFGNGGVVIDSTGIYVDGGGHISGGGGNFNLNSTGLELVAGVAFSKQINWSDGSSIGSGGSGEMYIVGGSTTSLGPLTGGARVMVNSTSIYAQGSFFISSGSTAETTAYACFINIGAEFMQLTRKSSSCDGTVPELRAEVGLLRREVNTLKEQLGQLLRGNSR